MAGAISAADAKQLYNVGGGYVATEWAEADIQLELYGVLLGTLLGTTHVVTKAHVQTYRYYERIRTRFQAAMNREYGITLAPALLVFHFQLHYRSWFDERFTHSQYDTAAPDIHTGLKLFTTTNNLNWIAGYEEVPALVALRASRPGRAGGSPPGPLAHRNVNPPGEASPAPAAPQTFERVQNIGRDPRYFGSSPVAVNIKTRSVKDAIQAEKPPNVTRGGRTFPTCLSWHLKGTCSEGCNQIGDHVANSAEEKEKLWDWTKVAFA